METSFIVRERLNNLEVLLKFNHVWYIVGSTPLHYPLSGEIFNYETYAITTDIIDPEYDKWTIRDWANFLLSYAFCGSIELPTLTPQLLLEKKPGVNTLADCCIKLLKQNIDRRFVEMLMVKICEHHNIDFRHVLDLTERINENRT